MAAAYAICGAGHSIKDCSVGLAARTAGFINSRASTTVAPQGGAAATSTDRTYGRPARLVAVRQADRAWRKHSSAELLQFELSPYDLEHVPRVALCSGIVYTKFNKAMRS